MKRLINVCSCRSGDYIYLEVYSGCFAIQFYFDYDPTHQKPLADLELRGINIRVDDTPEWRKNMPPTFLSILWAGFASAQDSTCTLGTSCAMAHSLGHYLELRFGIDKEFLYKEGSKTIEEEFQSV